MKTRALVLFFVVSLGIPCAAGRTIVAITASNQLFFFDSATPGTITSPVAISGLVSGDELHGIDYRPSNGVLYALGINPATSPDTGRIYAINTAAAVATQIGTNFSISLSDGASYGFDFDATIDRIRVTNSVNQNFRVNPDTGGAAGVDTSLTSGSQVVGLAYDRNDRNPNTATTLFGIDSQNNRLVRIGSVDGSPSSPNAGVVTSIGPTGLTVQNTNIGFDIAEDGVAYASMPVLIAGTVTYRFYVINLASGTASVIGNIGTGVTAVRGIAAVPSPVANIDTGQFFSTIQAAVSNAATLNGHTIVVNAGTFNELVTVNKSLTFFGAKSGVIATATGRGVNESIVRGTGAARTTAFKILANNVTIDGFTVQDTSDPNNLGAGIFMGPNLSGAKIRNNIIQNNISGLQVSNNSESNPLIIERNLFANNNVAGPISGTAIYTDQFVAGTTFTNAAIDNNTFQGNQNVGILLGSTLAGSQKNIAITNNTMDANGNAILIFNTLNAFITGNTITHSVASQLVVGGGIDGLDISENFISAGTTRGIRIGDFGGGGTNSNVVIGCNFIVNNPTAGLEIDSAANSYTGTLLGRYNYWGSSSGPTIATNPGGTGDKIVDPGGQVSFQPFRADGVDQQAIAGFQCYPGTIFYGINSANNNLIRFTSANPLDFTSTAITGLVAGDTIVGIDFRPATGEFFGLGSGSRLYVINPITGTATQRGINGAFTLSGTAFGFDFNPVVDRIRVVSDTGQNLRLNPNDGTLTTDTPVAYASGDPKFGVSGDAGGAAYTNNYAGATRTTLYDIDTFTDTLVHQGSIFGTPVSPNAGQLFTIGPIGFNTDDATHVNNAFDIYSPVPGVNRAFAALTATGTFSALFQVNLVSGSLSTGLPIGLSSPGLALVRGLAAAPTGMFQFSAPSYLVSENAAVATITINRAGGSEGIVKVMFTTTDGTATGGSDYTNADQLVTFGFGETSKTVQIPLSNDSADESSETILLKLQDQPGGGFIGLQSTATLTIVDDDVATPTLTAQSSSTAAVGEAIFDVATISSSSFLGGTLSFQLFGPNDTSCGTPPIFTSTVPVNGNGNYASASFTPTTPGAYRWVVSYSGDVDHNAIVSTGCNGANQTFAATATVLGNIASRLRVETGDNVLIAGFIVTGTQTKKVIVRGIGTSLPLAGNLQDPTLELHDGSGGLIEVNDNWVASPNKQAIIDSALPPASDFESAIVAFLPANNSNYTAILRGANNSTGIGVVEAYDLDRLVDSELGNISTRGFVSTGDNILIAGTIVVGKNPQNVIVRAIGPSLPLQGKMDDPILELHDGNGGLIEVNDNWVDSPNKQAIINTGLPPADNRESAILATLPGNSAGYTAIVRGVNNAVGIAVVEVYALP